MRYIKVEKCFSKTAPSPDAPATTGSAASQRVDCTSSRLDPTQETQDFGFAKVKNSHLNKCVKGSTCKIKEVNNRVKGSTNKIKEVNNRVKGSTTVEKQIIDSNEELILLS